MKVLALNALPLSRLEIDETLRYLPEIEILYLRNLGLTTLPPAVYELKQLKKLFLRNRNDLNVFKNAPPNNFSADEQTRIRQMLPGCEIEF